MWRASVGSLNVVKVCFVSAEVPRLTEPGNRLLQPPFLTCEAVISESLFLLRRARQGVPTLLNMLQEDLVRLSFRCDDHLDAVTRLIAKYHNVPMSLADACLVRMSELHDGARVFTLDADFRLYRRHSRQTIPLIFPRP